MKNTNIFKCLAIALLMCPMLGFAMEPNHTTSSKTCYVDLSDKSAQNLTFYKEYKAEKIEKTDGNLISFNIKNCDQLPIMVWGDCRWFYTSAIEGHVPMAGQGFEIIDSSITHVYAVRAKGSSVSSRYWSHIYFGFNENNPIWENGAKKVFQGKILYKLYKSTTNVGHKSIECDNDALRSLSKRFRTDLKGITYFYCNPEDTRMREKEQIQFNPENILPDINKPYRYDYTNSSTCYWTKEENKLKGIKYENK